LRLWLLLRRRGRLLCLDSSSLLLCTNDTSHLFSSWIFLPCGKLRKEKTKALTLSSHVHGGGEGRKEGGAGAADEDEAAEDDDKVLQLWRGGNARATNQGCPRCASVFIGEFYITSST
jgi:hypothetical protein